MLTAKRPKRMTNIKYKVSNTLNENSLPMKESNFFLREGVERKLKPCSAVRVKNSLVRLHVYKSCDALQAFKRTPPELLFHWVEDRRRRKWGSVPHSGAKYFVMSRNSPGKRGKNSRDSSYAMSQEAECDYICNNQGLRHSVLGP